MQKSKKMMVSLCGLALSSLFVLNNKSVVHADTVDGSQNNAISWDSDSDQAQGVQNNSEQSSVQKVDDHQPNQVSATNSRAETSNVESSSVAPRTTNQNTPVQSPRVANVQDAQKTSPVVINNPANNKVHVHYIDSNGNAVENSTHDYDIDATKTGQGSYTVPNGYSLNVPDGKYNVDGGKFSVDTLKGNTWHTDAVTKTEHHMGQWNDPNYDEDKKNGTLPYEKDGVLYIYNKYQQKYDPVYEYGNSHVRLSYSSGDVDIGKEYAIGWANDRRVLITNRNNAMVDYNHYLWLYNPNKGHAENTQMTKQPDYDTTTVVTPAYDTQQLPVAFVDSNNNIVGMIQNYSGKVGTTQNVSLTVPTGYKLADGVSLPTSVTFQNSTNPLLVKVVPNGKTQSVANPANNTINVKFVDQTTGAQVGTDTIDLTKAQNGTNYYNVPKGYGAVNNSYQVGTIGYSWKQKDDWFTDSNNKFPKSGTITDPLVKLALDDFYKVLNVKPSKANVLRLVGSLPSTDTKYTHFNIIAYDDDLQITDPDNAVTDSIADITQERLLDYMVKNDHINAQQYHKLVDTLHKPVESILDGAGIDFDITANIGLTDSFNNISGNTVTVPVHKTNSFSFADNSGNAKSAQGNTVDVTLTKPQSVNPATDARCQAQATRTIQINFPDGQVPDSYKGIVDKSGKLVQTVHFTRTATEDALTGNILQYGNWTSDNKDHNFIGFEARTLPRIPGYTLSIKPANA